MAGRRQEGAVIRVIGRDQDAAKAGAGPLLEVQPDLVHPLRLEADRALFADELEAEVHLAAEGDTAGLDDARRAAGEGQKGRGEVLVLDLAHRASRPAGRPVPVNGRGRARQGGYRAAEIARDRQDVAAEIAERPAAAGRVGGQPPAEGSGGGGEVVLEVPAIEMHWPADDAG